MSTQDQTQDATAEPQTDQAERPKRRRGFNAMSPELHRSIASMGGKQSHASGKAHRFTSEEARLAGKKGGEAVAKDRAYMKALARRGGSAERRIKAKPPAAQE